VQRIRSTILATAFVLLFAHVARPADTTTTPPPSRGPIIPRIEPLEPRAFTLEDRYLDAARRGDLGVVKLCLEKGADPHAKDGFGRSALLLAARDAHDLELVTFLKNRGLPTDEPDVRGRTSLGYAAGNGDHAIVSYLLDQGAAVNRADVQGQTPLLHAALIGSKETVARLLAAGANVNARDQFGDTPLIAACAKGLDEIARLLVEKGADPKLEDQEGRTAAERAAPDATFCRGLSAAAPNPVERGPAETEP